MVDRDAGRRVPWATADHAWGLQAIRREEERRHPWTAIRVHEGQRGRVRLLAALPEPKFGTIAVFGSSVVGPSGVDTRFTGILRFASGLTAQFASGFTSDHRGLEAIGSDGWILAPDPWSSEVDVLVRNGEEIRVKPTNAYRLELENMGAAIRGEMEPLLGRRDALGQARAIAPLYESAAAGPQISP